MLKNIIVAGAAGALGRVLVKELLTQRCRVLCLVLNEGERVSLEAFLKEQGLPAARILAGDLSKAASVSTMLTEAREELGMIEGLISVAGGFRYAKVEESSEADCDFLFNANFKSCYLLCREVLKDMKQANFGRLVFISSQSSVGLGEEGMALYTASKAALNMFVRSVAREVRTQNIAINAVLPSIIDTPVNRREMPEADFESWVTPTALVGVIVGLLENGAINGGLIPVTGKV
jgi:NAD(P)-dependent dehydrogenase (short-subunit alcohol dehydrogenase family)